MGIHTSPVYSSQVINNAEIVCMRWRHPHAMYFILNGFIICCEIIYPISNFNGGVKVWDWINKYILLDVWLLIGAVIKVNLC